MDKLGKSGSNSNGQEGAGGGSPAPGKRTMTGGLPSRPAIASGDSPWRPEDVRMATPGRGADAPEDLSRGLAQQYQRGGEFGHAPGAGGKRGVMEAMAADTPGSGAHVDRDQVVIEGDVGAAVQGSRSIDQLGASLGERLPFERYRVVRDDGGYAVEGKLNPWVRIVDGVIKEIGSTNPEEIVLEPGKWVWSDPDDERKVGDRIAPGRPHQTPAEYAEADGKSKDAGSLFRGVRGAFNSKKRAPSSLRDDDEAVEVPPDGNQFGQPPGQAPDARRLAQQTQAYREMKAWDPKAPIQAADPTADEPVVRQIAGDNYATQYISSTKQLLTACRATAYNWAGSGGLGDLRAPRSWGPVIRIDVKKLRQNRLYDLSKNGPHRDALFREMRPTTAEGPPSADLEPLSPRTSGIANMAERDDEVLIDGAVPGEAIVEVYPVADVLKLLATTDHSFIDELRRKVCDGDRIMFPKDAEIIKEAGLVEALLAPKSKPKDGPSGAEKKDEVVGAGYDEEAASARSAEMRKKNADGRNRKPKKKMVVPDALPDSAPKSGGPDDHPPPDSDSSTMVED